MYEVVISLSLYYNLKPYALDHKPVMAMEIQDLMALSVSFLGVISVCKTILRFVRWVWIMFLRPPKNLIKTYGSWAIITGSTDGIGRSLSLELASRGLNLLLVGRNPSKLEATSKQIQEKNHLQVQVKTMVVDLADASGEEILRKMEDAMEGLDVGILINNAGVAYPYSKYLHEVDLELTNSVIKVNAEAATWITKAVISVMLKKKKMKKGAIVNIGSGSSVVVPSYPLNSIYAATKAYIAMFSKSINLEYKHHGIDVQCQIPLLVATKMTKIKKSNFIIASPKKYAKESVRWIGYEQICTPIFSHSLQWFLLQLFPDSLVDWYLFRYYLGMRKKALKKEALRAKGN